MLVNFRNLLCIDAFAYLFELRPERLIIYWWLHLASPMLRDVQWSQQGQGAVNPTHVVDLIEEIVTFKYIFFSPHLVSNLLI
jgi:hypothetical protein